MVTTYLQGGLGNYMFQIAVAVNLAHNNNDIAVFSTNQMMVVHKPINQYRNTILRKINFVDVIPPPAIIYHEQGFEYKQIPYQKDMLLIGYFQSEKYFNEQLIRYLFSIPSNIKDDLLTKYGNLLDDNTCSIHVRHGDYVRFPDHHPLCSLEYYNDAIKLMPAGTKFLIFSDNVNWCKENFVGDNVIIMDTKSDVIDLYLMSLCKNNIIANSSFSWWGAWLNDNPNKIVITPDTWFGPAKSNLNLKDLIPNSWVKI